MEPLCLTLVHSIESVVVGRIGLDPEASAGSACLAHSTFIGTGPGILEGKIFRVSIREDEDRGHGRQCESHDEIHQSQFGTGGHILVIVPDAAPYREAYRIRGADPQGAESSALTHSTLIGHRPGILQGKIFLPHFEAERSASYWAHMHATHSYASS